MDSLLSVSGLVNLHRFLSELPIAFRLKGGPFVAGGAIVRSLLNLPLRDVDIWVPEVVLPELERNLADANWAPLPSGKEGSAGSHHVWYHIDDKALPRLDLIPSNETPEQVTARFDWRCTMLATDGKGLYHRPWALDDVSRRSLVPQRRTTAARLDKYRGMGFSLARPEAGILLPEDATWEERLGHVGVPCGPGRQNRGPDDGE